jgi:chemotaxis protein methyltransferase CheR
VRDSECVSFLQWALPRMGLRWPGFRRVRRQVCRRVARRIEALGLTGTDAYRARLETDPDEWAVLDACCWISVSRFHRDRAVWECLRWEILPELARAAGLEGRRVLRAWSAGCASGEEPYSLRIVWDLAVARDWPDVELEIVATDANAALLERARRAVYAPGSLKDLPASWRSIAFVEGEGEYRLRDALRDGVQLRRQDLRESMPDPPFDLILCRNLAFTYFEPELQRVVLDGMVERLSPRGLLLIGVHEKLPENEHVEADRRVAGLHRVDRRASGSRRSDQT